MKVESGPILAVLGAINVDLVVSGAPLPHEGETVTGGTFAQHHGGKGGNQAVAAARALGDAGRVALLGAVGDDRLGAAALEALSADGVVADHITVDADAPTGVALIVVGSDGENQISMAPGANGELEPDHVVGALETLRPHLLLASLEIPARTARAGLAWCRDHGVLIVLNPAPAQPWARDLLPLAMYVTPNERELATLGELPSAPIVIETRGGRGAVIHREEGDEVVPAPAVDAVDTTGAGDCFNGVLAARLVEGMPLADAVLDAVVASALSVTEPGAREGMPTREQIAAKKNEA